VSGAQQLCSGDHRCSSFASTTSRSSRCTASFDVFGRRIRRPRFQSPPRFGSRRPFSHGGRGRWRRTGINNRDLRYLKGTQSTASTRGAQPRRPSSLWCAPVGPLARRDRGRLRPAVDQGIRPHDLSGGAKR
jgi:hypothetical protein